MYAEFNGNGVRPNDVPIDEENKIFLGDLWNIGKGHNQEADWLKNIKNGLRNDKHLQHRVVINVEKVTKQYRKRLNWKTPGKDDI